MCVNPLLNFVSLELLGPGEVENARGASQQELEANSVTGRTKQQEPNGRQNASASHSIPYQF